MKPIYLDNAASTPVKSGVLAKFNEVASSLYGNPSSIHLAGIEARNAIWDAQEIIANKLNCNVDELFFTSGATMSNNVLIQGVVRNRPETMFITSTVEHNDIMELYDWLPYTKHMLGVDKDGYIDLKDLWNCVKKCRDDNKPCLVSIQMANSETGIIQPINQIAETIHTYGGFFHVDATQYIPYYPIDVKSMGIDALSMSGQKIGGLKGSGLLYINQSLQPYVSPIIFGEQGLIGGTLSTPLIASLGEAFDEIDYDVLSMQHKRDIFLSYIQDIGGILIGNKNNRLPNNIYVRFPNVNGMILLNLLDENGIYIGTGSACSTDSDKPSHVALAYGLSEDEAYECVRFTISDDNTYEELEYVISVLKSILELLK